MRDKVALRELAADLLPEEIVERPKQPYRAPEVVPFFGPERAGVGRGVAVARPRWRRPRSGTPARVGGLLKRCRAGRATGMREGMALVGILSTQLWHSELCEAGADAYPPETSEPHVRIDRSAPSTAGEAA